MKLVTSAISEFGTVFFGKPEKSFEKKGAGENSNFRNASAHCSCFGESKYGLTTQTDFGCDHHILQLPLCPNFGREGYLTKPSKKIAEKPQNDLVPEYSV